MERPTVRSGTREDVESVLALWGQARSRRAQSDDDERLIRRLLEHDPDALLVAEVSGRVVGTLVAGWDGWRGNMYRLAVAHDQRRNGIARGLVEEAHARLAARGAGRVTALVGDDDPAAVGLWTSLGYERDEHVGRYFRNL